MRWAGKEITCGHGTRCGNWVSGFATEIDVPPLPSQLEIIALDGLPMVQPGDNLAEIIVCGLKQNNVRLRSDDIVVAAQKIISKAEDRYVQLATIAPGEHARDLAERTGKDPRLLEIILSESSEVVAVSPGVIITRHRSGHVMANAGVDQSNIDQHGETVLLLPVDADKSAARLRTAISAQTGIDVGVIVADSFGRPWRMGTTLAAIGVSGVTALWDRRGDIDRCQNTLNVTQLALADMAATAAGLVMGEADEGRPVAVVRGLSGFGATQTSRDLIRDPADDLFNLEKR